MYRRGVELWLPIGVEPAATKGINHRVERSHIHAPTRLTSQQNAGHTTCGIIELLRELGDLIPRRMQWHGQVMLRENLLVVHQETTLAIERERVRMSLEGERRHNRLEEIVVIVITLVGRRHLIKVWREILEPAVMCPNGGLVTADGGNIKFPCICSNILGNFRTQIIFR